MSQNDHSHGSPAAASGGHDDHDIRAHIRGYMIVFAALIIGTFMTVWVSYIHFESVAVTVAIALLIASVKGFLVAAYFMHLISEKKMIYSIMAATVFFFIGLMGLTVWSMNAGSIIHIK